MKETHMCRALCKRRKCVGLFYERDLYVQGSFMNETFVCIESVSMRERIQETYMCRALL